MENMEIPLTERGTARPVCAPTSVRCWRLPSNGWYRRDVSRNISQCKCSQPDRRDLPASAAGIIMKTALPSRSGCVSAIQAEEVEQFKRF
jgi:hypothetical protein